MKISTDHVSLDLFAFSFANTLLVFSSLQRLSCWCYLHQGLAVPPRKCKMTWQAHVKLTHPLCFIHPQCCWKCSASCLLVVILGCLFGFICHSVILFASSETGFVMVMDQVVILLPAPSPHSVWICLDYLLECVTFHNQTWYGLVMHHHETRLSFAILNIKATMKVHILRINSKTFYYYVLVMF